MNEHIGRRQAIGLGPEVTPGTPVDAVVWLPKRSGVLKPTYEKTVDDSSYGVIDGTYDSKTVKNMTDVECGGILRDDWIGHLLKAALGTHTAVQCITITGASGGTPARGDAITSATGSFVGTIKKVLTVGAVTYYFVSTTSGVLTNGASNLTNGTWSGGTIGIKTGVKGHLFTRLNNNTHPAYTLYGSDPVGDERTPYCLMDTFDIDIKVGDFAQFDAKFKGKKLLTASAQSPVYTEDNGFLAKHANVSFADNEAALNAASAVGIIDEFKLTVNKNLTDFQAFGDDDIASLHNQKFDIQGDLDALYNSTTFRDYVKDSTKKACRLSVINDDVTALLSDSANSIYPSIYFDMARLSFSEWARTGENDALVKQTMGFTGEFDGTAGMTIEVLLLNDNASAY